MKIRPVTFSSLALSLALWGKAVSAELGGLEKTASTAGISGGELNVTGSLEDMVGFVLSFVGVVFLVLLIWGGFLWMTSGGNEESVKKARTVVVSAVIGLVIVLSAYLITQFIGTSFGA